MDKKVCIEIIENARSELEKFKQKFIAANTVCEEAKAFATLLNVELNKLQSNIAILKQKIEEKKNIDSSNVRSLIKIEIECDGCQKALSDFNELSNEIKNPTDKFEIYRDLLNNLRKKVEKDEPVDVADKTKDIFPYIRDCLEFINFYNKYKVKLNTTYDILKSKNKEFEQLHSEKSWSQWCDTKFKPFLKTTVLTIFSAVISFYTNKILKDFYTE